ncbi:MAG TPA: hypothetical protein VGM54_10110 [Chthoniobacter sp.]|jgi:hypothetical protein
MTYFVTAISEDGSDHLHKELECETFEDAAEDLRELARRRWPGQAWRPTCIVEKPERRPLDLAIILGRAAA